MDVEFDLFSEHVFSISWAFDRRHTAQHSEFTGHWMTTEETTDDSGFFLPPHVEHACKNNTTTTTQELYRGRVSFFGTQKEGKASAT